MRPLQPRSIPFPVIDGNGKNQQNLANFDNLAAILRYRATNDNHQLASAFTVVDAKGKEPVSISWEKLNARAEKIAMTIRNKAGLQMGDRVALIYRKSEVLDFIVALFGCFLAGMVAVPINAADDLSELSFILNLTSANLILTTDFNHRAFIKDMQTRSMEIPANVEWWKTNDFGTWYPTKKVKDHPPIKVPELAYIEYAKAVNGELKGVTITHQAIMAEGRMYKASVTETEVSINDSDNTLKVTPKQNNYGGFDTVVSYLEPRQQIGMVLSVLCSVYCGNHTIFTSGSIIDTPAVWIYVLSKYKATIALSDYSALNRITKYYQDNAKEVHNHSKKVAPDLSSLRYLFIDSCVSKPDLNQLVAEKLLRPLGNNDDPMSVVCPVASLAEHGGMILSMRDNVGPAQLEGFENGHDRQSVIAEGQSSDVWECLLDAEALKMNKVVVVAAGAGARRARTDCHEVLVSSFGFVIPEATVAIVDPDTLTLCPPDTTGEVWIDAPSISGGFWALPRHSEAIFHAKPTIVSPDTMYPEIYNQEFLRTGLVGTLIGGRLVIFGNYEDRIRQQRFGETHGLEEIYFSNDVVDIIESRTLNDKCVVFDITVNDQHLPVVACESSVARTELAGVTAEIEESLLELLGIRLFAVVVVANNALPRQLKHGRRQIHALMTKRAFLNGQLTIRYIRMDVDRTVFNLATNDDPGQQSIWRSGLAYELAIRQRVIMPHHQQQHTGMETVRSVIDERTDFDLSKFSNIVDVLQWRTALHPEETAFVGLSHNGSGAVETKPYTWRKINYTIASLATYLIKRGLKRGRKALVVVPFSVDWILAIYACLVIGVTPIPVDVPDPQQQQVQRIKDDVEVILTTARDLNVTYVLVNGASESILKNKPVNPAMRQLLTSTFKDYKLPEFTNINKAAKHHKLLGKESGMAIQPEWLSSSNTTPPLILSQLGTDGKRYYPALRHETILQQCRTQKTTCQMKWQRGIVATGLGACDNLGLLYSTFCGVYVGCITVMIPTEDFYLNPFSFFEMVQRYKAKDICVTLPLMQYAMNRMSPNNDQRRLALHSVQNIMMMTEGRPRPIFYQHLSRFFSLHRLEKEALNTTYSHIANPMITTRSYMLVEPIVLVADLYWLRRGIVRSLPLEEESRGVVLNDSGIVPSNTMVAIVNPETNTLCPSNVVGEIWVSSDCNVKQLLTGGKTEEDLGASVLEVTLPGTDPRTKYMRTGDLGFLWNVQRRGNMMDPMLEEGQCLYVLGPKCETLERNGLMHFPGDVETSIERCHTAIPANGSIVVQHGKEIVAIVAVKSKEYATSATPLIVSAVLENHSFLVDTVVIILPTNLPRSRFGEKQRDKALTAYADKKL
ncbi:uncharacterized protein BX664DRAFT_260037 [Halteromyces radiatus]|uniref:uncharacterized protein n=1 Tax=Halteromyces radiatus TaxID=101107 RepID=UPI00221E863C|nr:uncharacterized protein BX664DRAFT_260037 [Halteromyces radiatus]KAI8093527.1 hypothetical protein BX664DRAFT_260037 [Halteromyces radiatus]